MFFNQSAALGQSKGLVKSFWQVRTLVADTSATLLPGRKTLQKELLKDINRTSRTDLMPQGVFYHKSSIIKHVWISVVYEL